MEMMGSEFKFERPPSSASDSGSGEDHEIEMDNKIGKLTCVVDLPPSSPVKAPKSPTKQGLSKKLSFNVSQKKSGRVYHAKTRTLYTSGRPPWYDTHGQLKEAFVIGICGGSASGKTTVARRIIEELDVQWVSLLSMDSFYKVLSEKEHHAAALNEYNFDHPDAFDFHLLKKTLKRLKEGKSVDVPIYNFVTHGREAHVKTIYGANVVIFEGIMAFCNKELLELMDMKIFVDTDSDIRLARRLQRDIAERGRELEGGENKVAIDLIVMHVHTQLQKRGFKLRTKLANSCQNGQNKPDTLHVLEQTPQVQGLHTFIRNKETCRDEFIFYSKRLMRLLFEFAMSMLPFKSISVDTPQGIPYSGKRLDARKICGVSILRAGETMEQALCEVCKDIRLGKILIQTNLDTGEPELHYLRLPKDIKESHVMLMDATVATGAAAMMAIRVLLDHDVPEENITLLSLLMADSGVYTVAYAFPKVKIVTTAVDKEVNDKFHILPGIGKCKTKKKEFILTICQPVNDVTLETDILGQTFQTSSSLFYGSRITHKVHYDVRWMYVEDCITTF
ncbi:hypothetical protein KUTeg_016434 [Tegillarca granosa]|uniref:uridine/cytidine kinase n=1 Tax=Tegillarca granosa TaxID=220873 RepID=A0ABQ9EKW0_TEGGR|nr:hypothetical protein KUTeg_016434 [Tegillarca granosa]